MKQTNRSDFKNALNNHKYGHFRVSVAGFLSNDNRIWDKTAWLVLYLALFWLPYILDENGKAQIFLQLLLALGPTRKNQHEGTSIDYYP